MVETLPSMSRTFTTLRLRSILIKLLSIFLINNTQRSSYCIENCKMNKTSTRPSIANNNFSRRFTNHSSFRLLHPVVLMQQVGQQARLHCLQAFRLSSRIDSLAVVNELLTPSAIAMFVLSCYSITILSYCFNTLESGSIFNFQFSI